MITTAVIMAAGKGTRFGAMTETKPKGFIEFKGIPMVVRSIENLISAGISKIIIGTGYHCEWYDSLAEKYPQIETVFSPRFAETNSMETLARCKDAVGEADFLLLESDIVYEQKALAALLEDPHPNIMLVTPVTKFQDQYYIASDEDGYLVKCTTVRDEIDTKKDCNTVGELVGLHKISNKFYKIMLEAYEVRIKQEERAGNGEPPEKTGYEFILEDVATGRAFPGVSDDRKEINSSCPLGKSDPSLYVLVENNLQWYEIDDEADLAYAERHLTIS